MENILDLYQRIYNKREPVICLDEFAVQLLGSKVDPIPAQPGKAKKEDYEYVREGTCSIFVVVEPLAGKRFITVTEKRRKEEFALILSKIAEEWYPPESADVIHLVMDNLNTHHLAVAYDYFEPERARRIVERIRVHHTPVHASWLNMAEIEIGAIGKESLCRRIDSVEKLKYELKICEKNRNDRSAKITWRFTTEKARNKLGNHYPKVREMFGAL
jgi:hypothetical protein